MARNREAAAPAAPETQATDGSNAEAILVLDPALIAPSRTNPRKTFDEATLRDLAASMQADGQVQPALVRPLPPDRMEDTFRDREPGQPLPAYELVVGERRWRAAKLAGLPLRAELRPLTDLQVIRIQIIENLQREEVHPLEEAEGYDYLLRHSSQGVTTRQLAAELGKSEAYVFHRMKLLDLCPEVRVAFRAGALDTSTALELARIPTAGLQEMALDEIRDMALAAGAEPSFRQVRKMIQSRYHTKMAVAGFDISDPTLLPGCGACTVCPKRTSNQPLLFAELDVDDVCTDPDCFADKRKASVQRGLDEAREKGWTVLQGDEAKEVLPKSHSQPEDKGYNNVNDEAYVDADGNSVTWWDLWQRAGRKAPKLTVLVDPHNELGTSEPYRLLSDEAANELLKRFPAPKSKEDTAAKARAPHAKRQFMANHALIWDVARQQRLNHLLRLHLQTSNVLHAQRTLEDAKLVLIACVAEEITEHHLNLLGMTQVRADEIESPEEALPDALAYATAEQISACMLYAACDAMHLRVPINLETYALSNAAASHGLDVEAVQQQALDETIAQHGPRPESEQPDDEQDGDDDTDDEAQA